MTKKNYNVIGVMSGTSLDGVDLAYITFNKSEYWSYRFIHVETICYTDKWISELQSLTHYSLSTLKSIDDIYTSYLGEIILQFIRKYSIKDIDAICSHGHTALHQPKQNLTFQIGNLSKLSSILTTTVVCDFRTQDVCYGGQGAPLVPIGDLLLFNNYDACINLGGFSNISKNFNNERIAFDICPVNIVLNFYISKIGLKYDNKGEFASKGTINPSLFKALNSLSFYELSHPKSLGLEWVNKNIFPLISTYNLSIEDILSTYVEHIAFQISENIKGLQSVLFTGGGVYNTFLINRLKSLTKTEIILPEANLIEFKEALIFGLLGVLKLRGEVNCLASVTGAKKNHSSGKIYKPGI